jgi:light-harvesting complex I chlorophyll a/b binding protein 3
MGQQYFLGLEAVLRGSGDPKYPGGSFFNFANFGKGPTAAATANAGASDGPGSAMWDMKVKEVKNGRLAMVAWLGFMVQACTTHNGPVQNVLVSRPGPHLRGSGAEDEALGKLLSMEFG